MMKEKTFADLVHPDNNPDINPGDTVIVGPGTAEQGLVIVSSDDKTIDAMQCAIASSKMLKDMPISVVSEQDYHKQYRDDIMVDPKPKTKKLSLLTGVGLGLGLGGDFAHRLLSGMIPNHQSDWKHDPERLAKAEAKRLRKMNKNKK